MGLLLLSIALSNVEKQEKKCFFEKICYEMSKVKHALIFSVKKIS